MSPFVVFCSLFVIVYAGMDKMAAGPYDIIFQRIDYCDGYPKGDEFRYTFKMRKLNRTLLSVDFDVNVTEEVGDHDILNLALDKFSNNVWKLDFFKKEFDHVCEAGLTFANGLTRRFMKVGGISECPLPRMIFSGRNFIYALDLTMIPVFFYNKYRATFEILSKSRQRKFCGLLFIDFVPKPRKRKG